MVAKISYGNNIFGALSYNFEKVESDEGKVLETNRLTYNTEGIVNLQSVMYDFDLFLQDRIRTEKPVIHISLNPHPDDKLDDDQLAEIGKEYIEKLGFGNQPYIIYKHEDISRQHLHIVSLRVDENGKKLNDKFEKMRSLKIIEELEDKHNLIRAKDQRQNETFRSHKVNIDEGNVKKQIANIIKPLAKRFYYQSFKEYKALLSLYNISVEEVKGEIKGHIYNGLVYSATDDKGNRVGNPFKSSLFGKDVGYNAIYKKVDKSKILIKEKGLKESTKRTILDMMKHYPKRSDFGKKLSEKGIDVLLRENEQGRIYGVTFIDHNNSCVFNGSRLGKSFSANSFEEMFSNPHPSTDIKELDNSIQSEGANDTHDNKIDMGGGLLGILSLNNQGDNFEEEAFRKKLKRKRRRTRGL